jgi:3-deoxy-7-phosphoheptulonate synthase/chorismate mutase
VTGKPPASDERPTPGFDSGIEALRGRVDAIDLQLLGLLNARAAVVADIYALKARHGVTRFDSTRTGAILERLAGASSGPLSADDVRALFTPMLQYFVERYSPPQDR